MYTVYILACADGTLYTGIAKDLAKRIREHNEGKGGAKYTRSRRPVALAYAEPSGTRALAQQREAALKSLSRVQKLALIAQAGARASVRSRATITPLPEQPHVHMKGRDKQGKEAKKPKKDKKK